MVDSVKAERPSQIRNENVVRFSNREVVCALCGNNF